MPLQEWVKAYFSAYLLDYKLGTCKDSPYLGTIAKSSLLPTEPWLAGTDPGPYSLSDTGEKARLPCLCIHVQKQAEQLHMTTVCGSSTGSKQLTPGFLRTNLFFPAACFAEFLQGANLTYTKKINMLRKSFLHQSTRRQAL